MNQSWIQYIVGVWVMQVDMLWFWSRIQTASICMQNIVCFLLILFYGCLIGYPVSLGVKGRQHYYSVSSYVLRMKNVSP